MDIKLPKKMKNLDWKRIGLHVFFWGAYIPLNAVLACIIQNQPFSQFGNAVLRETFSLPIKIPFVYFFFYFVIPLYLDRNKAGKLILMSVIAFVVTTILYRALSAWFIFPYFNPEIKVNFFRPQSLLLYVFDLFITLTPAVGIKMIRVHYKSLEFEQQLIREKLESELNFLRAQTNPHFLFNTLNNLYGLARKKSDQTPEAIMMLSKIMRFMLYECKAPRIAVTDEAKVIRDYIDLEKLRYNDRLSVTYQEDTQTSGASIAPLLLLPFVENSFKHGASSTTGKVEIRVNLHLTGNKLLFSVENTIDADQPKTSTANGNYSSNGIGLKNIRRQLDLIYPERHLLKIQQEDGMYKAHLEIDLA